MDIKIFKLFFEQNEQKVGHDFKIRLVNIIERYKNFKFFKLFFEKTAQKGLTILNIEWLTL